MAESENKLVKSTENSVEMKIQDAVGAKERAWKIVRTYQSQFSCREAVERLIKIHADTKEDAAWPRKR